MNMPMPMPMPNGSADHLAPLLAQIVQNTGAIANNLGVLARQSGPAAEHIPVVMPLQEPPGHYGVFCHGCTMKAQSFIYPCQETAEIAAQFPPQVLSVAKDTDTPDPGQQARNEALRLARARVMDTPAGSLESEAMKSIIRALTD